MAVFAVLGVHLCLCFFINVAAWFLKISRKQKTCLRKGQWAMLHVLVNAEKVLSRQRC